MDIWHLQREFKKVFGVEKSTVVDELKGMVLKGEAKRILQRLWQKTLKQRGEMRTRVKKLIEYVGNNYDWIQNIPLVGGYSSAL